MNIQPILIGKNADFTDKHAVSAKFFAGGELGSNNATIRMELYDEGNNLLSTQRIKLPEEIWQNWAESDQPVIDYVVSHFGLEILPDKLI